MKCYNHPEEDAVAVCKSCGKGTCQNCAVMVSGISYCKTCVEGGRVTVSPTPLPQRQIVAPTPTGIPSRTPFIIGGIGVIISGIVALLSTFFNYGGMIFARAPYVLESSVVLSILMAILAVGTILAGFGYRGLKINYGVGTGTAAFALSVVACVLFGIHAVIGMVLVSTPSYYWSTPWYGASIWSMIISLIMFGVMQIMWGVAHINSRRFTGNSGLSMATGIILIVAGALTASVLVSFLGLLLFLVSAILVLLVFLMSKVPQVA